VQKCPYCDFNSHAQKNALPEQEYIAHLLDDLAEDAKRTGQREVSTIFIGGGTPSLFTPESIHKLLHGVKQRIPLAKHAEITLEANPGTVEALRFNGYVEAGVNRFSIGIQSFQPDHLKALGRIHDDKQAIAAINMAKNSQVTSFNLDLMHGLPQQSPAQAMADLNQGIALAPKHLSWYQLTIEPNTPFYSKPPELPDDDVLWDIQQLGHQRLLEAGYEQYEISAYTQAGYHCQHNLNYWRFGDYIGIGCGAHGKITDLDTKKIYRTVKVKHPRGYMELQRPYLDTETPIANEDLAFEFFINRFRLCEPCPKDDLLQLANSQLSPTQQREFDKACEQGLLINTKDNWQVTNLGRRYLNSLLSSLL
jgi:oxygen-independent coproporphyrinogen-3 oxidase